MEGKDGGGAPNTPRAASSHSRRSAHVTGMAHRRAPEVLGIEKLLAFLGAALVVAVRRPQLRECIGECIAQDGWQGVFEYVKAAI